ncbi:TIM barrel protein [Streptomyces sp. NPDC006798]|uniref:sugar phosphate isomerase/epimerase family protein n=1 Tax=Streptomyces sp. NPDC006798 TaxID=3155462 RepID=UPI0033C6552C
MPAAEVAALAADTGYQGVEVRAHPEEPVHPGIGRSDRAAVARAFERAGVGVLAVCGYPRVAAAGPDGPVLAEIADLVELAGDLGAPYVRVFPGAAVRDSGGGTPVPGGGGGGAGAEPGARGAPGEESGPGGPGAGGDAVAARRLALAAREAAPRGVRILLETHDSHRTGESVARVLDRAGAPDAGARSGSGGGADSGSGPGSGVRPGRGSGLRSGPGSGLRPAPESGGSGPGAVWDVLHTWLGGESPEGTWRALGPSVGYVQVKDVASREDLAPLALGEGVLPLADVLARASGRTWLSWEYEKRWAPEAAELPGLLVPGREYLERLIGRGM